MLPQEITTLANRILPLIAKSTNYYSYKGSGLTSQQWEALRTRLLADGLATGDVRDALQITSDGEQVASKGPNGYIKFRESLDKQKSDSLLTNLYSRYGAIATVGATMISLAALLIPLFKSDNNEEKIKELAHKEALLKVELDSLHKRLRILSKKQDSVTAIVLKFVPLVGSTPSVPHATTPSSQANRIRKGKAVSRKHS